MFRTGDVISAYQAGLEAQKKGEMLEAAKCYYDCMMAFHYAEDMYFGDKEVRCAAAGYSNCYKHLSFIERIKLWYYRRKVRKILR